MWRYFLEGVKLKSPQGSEVLTPEQCKMARAGLGLGIRDLAALARLSTNTLTRFERGDSLYPRTVAAIRAALEAAGVEVIEENGGGPGIRLQKAKMAGS